VRRFFWKIFSWFWLAVLVMGVTLAASARYSFRLAEKKWAALAASILPSEARQAVEAFDSGGRAALSEYTLALERREPVRAILFSGDGQGISAGAAPDSEAHEMAISADGDRIHIQGLWASQRAVASNGRQYVLVLTGEGGGLTKIRVLAPMIALPAVVAMGGALFCFMLARYVTAPIYRVRAAAAEIAEGRLAVRVGSLGHSGDELAALGRDFDHMAERLEALVAAQRRLLGEASHELRSPLARLTVALGLARQRPDEVPEHLERIALEAKKLDKLVGQLLLLSRIESRMELNAAPVDLTNLVHEIANDGDFEARAQSKRVEVISAAACMVDGSEDLIRSALENVVRNAVRHTSRGSSVEIELAAGKTAIICVRDHGPGLSEELLKHIFTPFRQSENGGGLGLAIAEGAIRAHAGSVRAANAERGGLIVQIEIPLQKNIAR
jgi:signal transduction histidine kinase